MKFLIQKINNKIVHDFSFTLLESIKYQNWIQNKKAIIFKTLNCYNNEKFYFKSFHKNYVPVGSIEFVCAWFQKFYNHAPKPINVPLDLFHPSFTYRKIFNGNMMDFESLKGKYFIKSNDKIKKFCGIVNFDNDKIPVPAGEYQISEIINIHSEWRAFVYKNELVGLQNYAGSFTEFPDINNIERMIKRYTTAPIAYTLDVGINSIGTFVIEIHDFFSCGLYGFADHKIYPQMLYRWHQEYINNLNNGK